jgi:hypothetical protein
MQERYSFDSTSGVKFKEIETLDLVGQIKQASSDVLENNHVSLDIELISVVQYVPLIESWRL